MQKLFSKVEPPYETRSRALDPIWRERSEPVLTMVPLREHIIRLSSVVVELQSEQTAHFGPWEMVSENLRLAASLRDISADTDVDGNSYMCSSAAVFDEANSEVAEKYLAGVIVFNLIWIAYEGAVKMANEHFRCKKINGKGALGRVLLTDHFGDAHFPHLRNILYEASDILGTLRLTSNANDKKLIASGSLASIGAEHLRKFRNAVTHGDLVKPLPKDWGEESKYSANDDPSIKQFHINSRLTLILIQILIRISLDQNYEIGSWVSEPQPADLLLTQLHCILPESSDVELPMMEGSLVLDDY